MAHGGDEQHAFHNATDAVSDAVAHCNGKFALGIIALTNFYGLRDRLESDQHVMVADAFRQRLSAILRPGDDLIALSEDMACLVLDDLMDSNHLELAALKLQRLFEEPIAVGSMEFEFSVCCGLVYAGRRTRMTKSAGELYEIAESACSNTLLTGQAHTIVNASDDQPVDRDWQLNQRIQAAMDNHEISFDYQPKIDLVSGELVGGEALVRWRDKGMVVPPDEFLAALNDETLWHLTVYGYRRVLREILDYDLQVPIAYNIDPASLAQPEFLEFVTRETGLWGVPPEQIVFEITENKELYDLEESQVLLRAIREHGFKVALDDFGAGHGNMRRIRDLPLDEIKLDRSLCGNIMENDDASRICQSVITLADSLGLTCVAEGIEDAGTQAVLAEFGCQLGQGFYLGAPMSITDFADRLN